MICLMVGNKSSAGVKNVHDEKGSVKQADYSKD